jgi:hypothetical protein
MRTTRWRTDWCSGILPFEGGRQLDPARAAREIGLMLLPHAGEPGQRGPNRRRQHRHAVLITLAAAHDDLVAREVDVLHAQTAALEHSEARAVEHQPRHTVEPLEHGADFVTGEDDR